MLLAAMLINAAHPAFEDAEEALDLVGGDRGIVAADIFTASV
jgi:hypothetical protein